MRPLSARSDNAVDMVCPVNWLSPLNRGLVGWWLCVPGLTGGSNFVDLCKRNYGTLVNGPVWQGPSGRRNVFGSLSFDGSDDYVTCGNITAMNFGTGPYTLAFWLKSGTAASPDTIIAKDDWDSSASGLVVYYASSSVLRTWIGSQYDISTVVDGTWHFVCYTRRSTAPGHFTGYADGKAVSTSTDARTLSNSHPLAFGADSTLSPGYYASVSLSDVCAYNRELTAGEVQALYLDGLSGYPERLNRVRQFSGGTIASAPVFRSLALLGVGR